MTKLQIAQCKKCGSVEHDIRYIPPETVENLLTGEKRVIEQNDYIKVTCSVCGYEWREEVLDKDTYDN